MPVYRLPVGSWGEQALNLVQAYGHPIFSAFATAVLAINGVLTLLLGVPPPWLWIVVLGFLTWRVVDWKFSIFIVIGLFLLWNQALWTEAITTLALVITSTFLSMLIALPLGLLIAQNTAVRALLLPLLDAVQTMPRFVYLIPAVALLGIDVVPAVFATMTLAIPAPARLIATGLMGVDKHVVEAGEAFGCSPLRVICTIKLPLALPAILLALNQCLMLALSMTVIASLIGAGGLGAVILIAISSLDAGQGLLAGFGIFVIALLLDRTTGAFASRLSHKRFLLTQA